MRRFKKFIIIVSASSALLVANPVPTQADVFGAGDAALLAQQIIQFLNDMSMDAKKWTDMAAKLDNVNRIVNTISNGKQAFTSMNNILQTSKMTVNTLQELDDYLDFVQNYSYDKIRITNAVSVIMHFARRSRSLYTDVEKTLARVVGSHDMNSGQMLNTLDKATAELGDEVRNMADQAKCDLAEMCHEVTVEHVAEQNRQFAALNII